VGIEAVLPFYLVGVLAVLSGLVVVLAR